MQCKHDREPTIDFRRVAALRSGASEDAFTRLCIHVQYIHMQTSAFICVSVLVEEGLWEGDVCNSSWYWPVSSEHSVNGRCAEESCTCLAVADTVMSTGCLMSPVNPVSLCWSCQREAEEGSYLRYKNRQTAHFLSDEGAPENKPVWLLLFHEITIFMIKLPLPKRGNNSTALMTHNREAHITQKASAGEV